MPEGLVLADLSDERRAAKSWLPDDDRDATAGRVKLDAWSKPSCWRHGAMNRVDPIRRIYRCQEMYCGVGAELVVLADVAR
jgi:hypothetical protein